MSTTKEIILPKLPVPELGHTLKRYLEAVKPILPEEKYKITESIVRNFEREIGPTLQKALLTRREILDNWAYDWWLDYMYLSNQACLPINSNPGMVFPPKSNSFKQNPADMATFGARLVQAAYKYKIMLDKKKIVSERAPPTAEGQPLCMAQYYRVFTSYRVPGIVKDILLNTETEYTKSRPHIIVMCNGQFYVMQLTKGPDAEQISEEDIVLQLLYILQENIGRKNKNPSVGLLTSLRRGKWAEVREQIVQDEQNRQNISLIEKSLLILCFDLNKVSSYFNSRSTCGGQGHAISSRDETNMTHQMIHGCGSNGNSGNRWFDKTIQLIIGSDGANGLCYEHSPAEGVATIQIVETLLKSCEDLQLGENRITDSIPVYNIPDKLKWNISSDIEKEIYVAAHTLDSFVQDLDFCVYRFSKYGKEYIKSCRVSPDVYIQLALQLTYYRLYGKLTATYESASTRRFLLGRVDCIRSNTMEVLQWAESMEIHSTTPRTEKTKLELFRAAIDKQTEIMKENISGHGIDVHLLGLQQVAKEMNILGELFEDEAYEIANHFCLSTSQVATNGDTFMGYGPVVQDGYGASYNPKATSIIFCLSSFYSCQTTDTSRFAEFLEESLNDIKNLLETRRPK